MIIGTSSHIFSLGELKFFNEYILIESNRQRKKCSCGKVFPKCKFWNDIYSLFLEQKKSIASKLFRKDSISQLIFSYLEAKNYKYYTDSSKDPINLLHYIFKKRNNLIVLHLVRDIRGYIYSHSKAVRKPKNLKYKCITRAAIEWILINYLIIGIIKLTKSPHILISYEKFCSKPVSFIHLLNNRFGMKIPENFIASLNHSDFHLLEGNNIRFKIPKKIQYDNRWQLCNSYNNKFFRYFIMPFSNRLVYIDSKIDN